jgi:asparagine synthase (glutamine-hydrolysing)
VCGIAVILPGGAVEVPPFAIDRTTAALRHRGPDARRVVRLPGCELGHTRLSVMDPENGAQPMTDASGTFTVTFNGEIYNHRELRRELEGQGVCFRTRCDTEVLLEGYARWGPGVLRRLNGQFAFAVWDAKERELLVARDRFGEKPLFWARTAAGDLLVASEIKAIVAAGLLRPSIDRGAVDAYLGLFYVPPDRTIFSNVQSLPPAHAAVFRADGASEQWRYWEPRYSCHAGIEEGEAVRQVRSLVEKAVRRQTVADVRVGAFLSGGLDSTTVVALMSRHAAAPVKTFAVGFEDLIDELPFARDVAEAYRSEHHEMQMRIDVAAMLDRMTEVYDEPFGDSSNIPTFLVSEYARRSVKVVLSGDGGDELFGGYDWYRPLIEGAARGEDVWERHVANSTGAFFDRSALWGSRRPCSADFAPRGSYSGMDGATAFDVSCYLPGDILVKVDRAAMAHGLETRAPFLDVELAEFVLGLPWEMRFSREGITGPLKRTLRAACEDLWPESVRGRGKQGFGAPVRHWLQQPAVVALWERVTRDDSPLLFLLPGLRDVMNELRPQRKWTLLCLGLWLERNRSCLAGLS